MKFTCCISGLLVPVPGIENISIPASAGYYHPIFTLKTKQLYDLYYRHTRNKLSNIDSYLLFCAFLQNTGSIEWRAPATCAPNHPSTISLIQNNLAQLISVTEKTAVIRHPSFVQPKFVVDYGNGSLFQVHNWIAAWQENILDFNLNRATKRQRADLQRVENALDAKLRAGTPIKELPAVVASWAAQAADFPLHKSEQYQRVIRSCFNSSQMFNTPLPLIKEVQEYCYANIEPDSIHFSTLSEILREGASRHLNYLGGSSLALGYTLLDTKQRTVDQKEASLKNEAELLNISASAPTEEPVREDYDNNLAYLKARLAYKVATTMNKSSQELDL